MTNYSLTRRYWISLVGLTSSVVLDGYSLWSRYWATLLGSPPASVPPIAPQTNGATASLVIPDVPRKRMRARKGLIAVAAVTTAIAAAFTGPLISHHGHNALKPLAAASESFPPVRLDDCPTLLTGYQGRCVAQLQADLNIIQGSALVVDGNFGLLGSPTYNAVIAFQEVHGLPQDGMVGPDMKKALAAALRPPGYPAPVPELLR